MSTECTNCGQPLHDHLWRTVEGHDYYFCRDRDGEYTNGWDDPEETEVECWGCEEDDQPGMLIKLVPGCPQHDPPDFYSLTVSGKTYRVPRPRVPNPPVAVNTLDKGCDKCGHVPVNRFGICDCYTQVKQLDGSWKYMWEMDEEKAQRIAMPPERRDHPLLVCKCGNYEEGVDGVCRWCHT